MLVQLNKSFTSFRSIGSKFIKTTDKYHESQQHTSSQKRKQRWSAGRRVCTACALRRGAVWRWIIISRSKIRANESWRVLMTMKAMWITFYDLLNYHSGESLKELCLQLHSLSLFCELSPKLLEVHLALTFHLHHCKFQIPFSTVLNCCLYVHGRCIRRR